MKVRLLRGRVAIRPIADVQSDLLVLPDSAGDWSRLSQKNKGILARSSHSAIVLGMGPPAIGGHGHEVPHGYKPGDEVVFTYQMNEKWSEDQVWEDGEPCMFIAQEHIQAVFE